jgi:nitrite reductase/ring-hydroxylating ferredoxin subunit
MATTTTVPGDRRIMSDEAQQQDSANPSKRTRPGYNLPAEGENGLFSQSWFPLCLSSDLPKGVVKGFDFLDGRVVAYRGENGIVRVSSAYCLHIGADLSVGKVVGNNIQCAFHRWEYDQNGVCVKTGFGPAPPNTCLFQCPTQERLGIVWVFNGEEPLWDLMDLAYPDEELIFENLVTGPFNCDGWVFACNTADLQHVQVVHGIQFDIEAVVQRARWDKWGYMCEYEGTHKQGKPARFDRGIRGTSTFLQQGILDGWWLGIFAGFSLPRPGQHYAFAAICVHKDDPQAAEHLAYVRSFLQQIAEEDREILNTIRPRVGKLVRLDKQLAQYFRFLKNYPRAHPSAEFIR